MWTIPAFPDRVPDGAASSEVVMRFEDIAQNGRALVEAAATSVNETLWRVALRDHPVEVEAISKGTIAILTRFVVETGDGPFSVDGPFDADARFVLAHGIGRGGEVDRIYFNAWVDTFAPLGRTNLPPPSNAGQRAVVARAFAEHVFTRPFAEPSLRRVTRLEGPGLPGVPEERYDAPDPAELLTLPEGGRALDESMRVDETRIVFGLRHTDSNQHVNSLVYPQHFEEAALRRFASLGHDPKLLARKLEIAYRKPCFAGQTARIALAAFELGSRLGAYGGVYDAIELEERGLEGARPHAFLRMLFERPAH